MAKTIMILGASILQLPAIQEAQSMGLNVVVLDKNPNAVGFYVPGVIKEVISTIDIDAAVDAAKRHHVDGVMTLATDMPMRTVATVAKECGLMGIDVDTAIKATDKAVMRDALKKAGVPVPRYFRAADKGEYRKAITRFKDPFVVKPTDNSGSRGITLVREKEQAETAYEYARKFSRNGIIVVEEYMTGPEVSVETLAINGEVHIIQITDKITTGAPHFVEMGHTQPTRLDCAEEIKRVAIAANQAIGIQNGPSHTEIIVTKDGSKVVELGARLGGDCITTHLVPLSTGVNMVKACIQFALGEEPDLVPKYSRGSAIRYLSQHEGTVVCVDTEEAEKMPGVAQISIVHGPGEHITDITDSGTRMGFVIASGENADDAAQKCEAALSKIHAEVSGCAD